MQSNNAALEYYQTASGLHVTFCNCIGPLKNMSWFIISARTAGPLQGARKDARGNEPVGSCAMRDARSTGPRALEGKNR